MGLADWWYGFRTTRLSKPVEDRVLFKATQGHEIRSILEIGVGDGSRASRLIDWLEHQGCESIRYAAIDMFEASGGIPLKKFHKQLAAAGTKPLPVPGNLASGLPRVAHTIGAVDLLILSEEIETLEDPGIQSFLPRVVHEDSIVLATDEDSYLYEVPVSELLAQDSAAKAA